MEPLRPNQERAKTAIILIWIVMALEIAALISGCLQYALLQIVASGGSISVETANANDSRERLIGIIFLLAYIISAVTFIRWFRRAYFNLHQRAPFLSHSEGWAAGAWFVPFVNLYRPYQIMKELYQVTKDLLDNKHINAVPNFNTRFLGWWWALWIADNLIGQFVFRYSQHAATLDALMVSTVASIINNLVGIPLALITIKVIKDYAAVGPLLQELQPDEAIAATTGWELTQPEWEKMD